jgi:ankyrin repeat protein
MITQFKIYEGSYEDLNLSDLWKAIHAINFYSFLNALKYDDIEEVDHDGDTPLIYSVWISNVDFVILLIKNGANVHAISGKGNKLSFIDLVKKFLPNKYNKIYRAVIKKHPNFEEECKLRQSVNKFNL